MQSNRLRIAPLALALALAASTLLSAPAGAAARETVLYNFGIRAGDGHGPVGPLIADESGALYGTTDSGGDTNRGTVFMLTPPSITGGVWTEKLLHVFAGADGTSPFAGLVADRRGALYGTTAGGGDANAGTVFRLTPPAIAGGAWTETVLHNFVVADGRAPFAGLIMDRSGALYGTTFGGGAANLGTVFRLTPPTVPGGAWTETILHSFTGADGTNPAAGLIMDGTGALYGTTGGGGGGNAGFGTVFKLAPPTSPGGAWTETVLHSFTGVDGDFPLAGLIMDERGALFGTTYYGGEINFGTVFRLTPPSNPGSAWTETVLHSFTGIDGESPAAGLITDHRGALYGATMFGGAANLGAAFKLTPPSRPGGAWTEIVLHSFMGPAADGNGPAALLADHRGTLFGTTGSGGGGSEGGTVFCLSGVREPSGPGMSDEFDDGSLDPLHRQQTCGAARQ